MGCFGFSALIETQQRDDTVAESDEAGQGPDGESLHLSIPTVHIRGEGVHFTEASTLFVRDLQVPFSVAEAMGEGLECGINFAGFAHGGDSPGEVPHISFRGEMIAPLAGNGHAPNNFITHQFLEAVANIAARYSQCFADFVGGQGAFGDIEQRMDLRDGPIDPPLLAHIAPVKDESPDSFGHHVYCFRYFCHNRNIRNDCEDCKVNV